MTGVQTCALPISHRSGLRQDSGFDGEPWPLAHRFPSGRYLRRQCLKSFRQNSGIQRRSHFAVSHGSHSLSRSSYDLALHHAPASQRHHNFTMAQILFTCPTVSMKVQHWLDEDHVPENEYEGITCPACTRLHFINRRTGRLLGHDKE